MASVCRRAGHQRMPEPADNIDLARHVDAPSDSFFVAKIEAAPIMGQVSVPNVILRFLAYNTAPYPRSF